jgi:hypothetical protein
MGFFDDDDDDSQRMRNLVMYKFYGTDKEMEEASPGFILVLIVIVLIIAGVLIF